MTGPAAAVGPDGHGGASSRIADALRTAILDGSYRPGERIRQEEVAARSGASRMPVREALRVLQAEGLVILVANSGAWVAKLTLAECAELYQIRERLEPLLLRASLPSLDADLVRRMTPRVHPDGRGLGRPRRDPPGAPAADRLHPPRRSGRRRACPRDAHPPHP
ncbi:MAG TPA: GntR family transcriptional regulator [Trebonia sp.]|nr:GntR family transcriptional regulator [Trebonia sp.]